MTIKERIERLPKDKNYVIYDWVNARGQSLDTLTAADLKALSASHTALLKAARDAASTWTEPMKEEKALAIYHKILATISEAEKL